MTELHLGVDYNGHADNLIYTPNTIIRFYGTYIPNSLVNIYIDGFIRTHIIQAQTDNTGYFQVDSMLPPLSLGVPYQIRACSAGAMGLYECSLFPDQSVETISLMLSAGGGGGVGGSDTVTIIVRTTGKGVVKTSGGDNALAVRTSITVPYGYQIYFLAEPAGGWQFDHFEGSGQTSTQNPLQVPVILDGTVTAVFTQTGGGTDGGDDTKMLEYGLIAVAVLATAYIIFKKK